MSVFSFYAEVSIGCVCVLMVLLYSIKRLPTPQLKFTLFHRLVLWHALYFLSDSVWAMVNDGVIPKNTFSVLAVNYSNAVILAALFYSCFIYAEMSTRPEMTRMQIRCLQAKLRIPIFVEMVILLVSFVAAPDFWLDKDLEPRDLYYFILAFIPIVYIMVVTVRCIARGLKPENRQHLKTYLIVASYTPGCIVAGGAQILFSLTTPIFCFWCTLIILFVYLNSQNQLISTDPLTSLNNRNQLQRYLLLQRDAKDSYVIMVDVDHFKQINDTYGHVEGDKALIIISRALKQACGRLKMSIFLCRYGGDEFLMIAQTETPDDVLKVVRDCLQEQIANREDSQTYTIEVSLGYARWDGNVANFKDCVAHADQKMYEDKRSA
ncbi:GGDEF domain-containing protein [uncultured Fibrobacter sp.]|uniref:GGDEF domain-containing protein n=1 Tax=uncultured Fibrobacter sp. TaxID=261512 RepID=UPI0025F93FF4|nr:GGDEF domain-containing protein [uncultured Fibrobacter sp.]